MNLKKVDKVLFLDIETVPQFEKLAEAPEQLRELFLKKFKNELPEDTQEAGDDKTFFEKLWNEKASLHPEFGKIVCISVGMIYNDKFVKKSFISPDETKLLNDFVGGKLAEKLNDLSGGTVFCAYNGEGFHLPFIAKRLIINGIMVPKMFFYPDLKPWERNFLADLKTLWRWGSYEAPVSFKLLAYTLGFSESMDDIDSTMIKDIFYLENDLKKISNHCENDVELLYKAYIKLFANSANA